MPQRRMVCRWRLACSRARAEHGGPADEHFSSASALLSLLSSLAHPAPSYARPAFPAEEAGTPLLAEISRHRANSPLVHLRILGLQPVRKIEEAALLLNRGRSLAEPTVHAAARTATGRPTIAEATRFQGLVDQEAVSPLAQRTLPFKTCSTHVASSLAVSPDRRSYDDSIDRTHTVLQLYLTSRSRPTWIGRFLCFVRLAAE